MADEELRKAFGELQQKVVETEQRVNIANHQVDALQRAVVRSKLTAKELSNLPSTTRTYESVGRAFVLRPAAEISEMLETRVKTTEERIKKIEEQKSYMERSVKESETSVRELVKQRKEKA